MILQTVMFKPVEVFINGGAWDGNAIEEFGPLLSGQKLADIRMATDRIVASAQENKIIAVWILVQSGANEIEGCLNHGKFPPENGDPFLDELNALPSLRP